MNAKAVKDGFERNIQTIIQLVIVAVILWFGSKLTSTAEAVVRMEAQLIYISKSIGTVEGRVQTLEARHQEK